MTKQHFDLENHTILLEKNYIFTLISANKPLKITKYRTIRDANLAFTTLKKDKSAPTRCRFSPIKLFIV